MPGPSYHGRTHQPGGSDPIEGVATVDGHVIEDEGTPLTQRAELNFVGAGVTAADAGGKTVVTIPTVTAGHVIEDEGSALTQRANMNFVGGGVTAADSGGKTVVTIPTPIFASLLDAKGDLVAASANDTAGKLTVGSDGQVLTADAASTLGVKWAAAAGGSGADYGARAYMSADQSITSATSWTSLNLDTERWDTDGIHSTVTNTGQFTVQTGHSGKYLCWGNILWDANITGLRGLAILSSALGAFVAIDDLRTVGGSSVRVSQSVATVLNMAAGDSVTFQVRQNSGGSLLVLALSAYSAECGIMRILG